MSKIDKEFFQEIYKNKPTPSESLLAVSNPNQVNQMLVSSNLSNFNKKELIYEFSIYHPTKNLKTQQVSVLGSCFISELKDNIYCVLDEVHHGQLTQGSFFFIENTFFIDFRFKDSKSLSR